MTLESSQVPCLICNTIFVKQTNKNADKPATVVEASTKVFNSCCKYLNVDINAIDASLNWNFNRESLPFCEICFLTTNKLQSLHEQIESLQQEVKQIVDELKASLTESHQNSPPTNKQHRNLNHGEASVQDKITNYRELALFGKSTYVLHCQRQTRSRTENSNKNVQQHTDIFDNSIQDFNDSEDDHFDDDYVEVDIKYEPVGLDCIESFETCTQDCPVNNSPSNGQKTKKYSDSIAQLLKLYQMHKRTPVIKLHRICEEKIETKSDTGCLLRKNENRLSSSSRKEMVRTVYMNDGQRLYGGVCIKSTPDGQAQCGDCGKIYNIDRNLKRHIKRAHLGIKEKDYKSKEGKKTLKVLKTPEGKTSYGGITIEPMQHGYFYCSKCTKRCPSTDALFRHIRWYHLGDEATRIYRERREAYRIKRQKALGNPVPRESIRKAEEVLKNKLYLQSALSSIASGEAGTPKESTKKVKVKKQNDTKRTEPPKRTESESDVESDESDQESNFDIDDDSNDPNFSPEHCENQEGYDSESKNKPDANSSKKKMSKRRVKIVWQTDGRKFCGGVELIVNEDETEWKCGKKNCSKSYTNMYCLTRHVKSAHLGINLSPKSLRKERKIKTRRKSKKTADEKGNPKKERPHFTADGLFFSGILSKKLENGWYQCGFERLGNKCEKAFPTSFATLTHIKTVHTKSEVTSLKKLRCLRMLITPEGKKVYGGVEINEPGSNTLECGKCKRKWPYRTGNKRYLENIFNHIRMNHLGEKATEMYRQRRRAVQIRKMKRLGRLVRKKDLIKAEEILKNQIPITAQVMFNIDSNGDPLDKSDPTLENIEASTESEVKSKESEDEDLGEYDFSVEEDDSEEEGPTEQRVYCELTKRKVSVKLRAKGGKKYCGDIELIEREGERQQCGKCKKVYYNIPSLSRHIKSVHYGFKEKSKYFKPKIQNVHYFKVIEDSQGRKTYAGIDLVDTHDGNIACGICLRSFKVLDHFRRHVRNLHPERLKSFQAESSSTETDATQAKTDQIDVQRTYFTKEGLFYNGVLSKKVENGKYSCGHPREGQPPCRRLCSTSFAIVSHIRREHTTDAEHPSAKPLKKFNRTITTDDGRKIFLGVEMVRLEDGNWQCGQCQKQFTAKNISGLMGHIQRMHEQKEGGIYICKYCGRNCGSPCWLKLHELKHQDEKTYACDECDRSYKQSASLTHHKRQVHKGIKRLTCEICGKQYYHTRDFVTHQLRHKGEKPFICSYCGKSFFNVYDLRNHERGHNAEESQQSTSTAGSTPVKDKNSVRKSTRKRTSKKAVEEFDCSYCDKSFGTSSGLKKHMAHCHSGSESESKDCWKEPSGNEPNIPDSSASTKNGESSAESANSSMPTLENMAPSSNLIDHSLNSFGAYPQQVSDPPVLVPVYDFKSPTFPVYGHPHPHFYHQ